MKHEESKIQIACVNWFKLRFPKYLLFAIPNGGARSLATGKILKAEGCTAGIPDLFLAYPKGQFAGLFIEMKTKKGVIQQHQKEKMKQLSDAGYKCVICRTIEDFIEQTNTYLQ